MATAILHVPDISCEHCERTVTKALMLLQGVQSVGVDVSAKQVRVTYDGTIVGVERMKEVLREEDYPVALVIPGT